MNFKFKIANKTMQALANAKAEYEAQGYSVITTESAVFATKGIYEAREMYYEDGSQRNISNYKNGKWHGEQERWYENGQKHYIANYTEGNLDGEQKMWFANGQQEFICNFKDGKQDGQQEGWNEDGTQRPSQLWENGKFIKYISQLAIY